MLGAQLVELERRKLVEIDGLGVSRRCLRARQDRNQQRRAGEPSQRRSPAGTLIAAGPSADARGGQ